jgi:IPT/TIG domain
MRRIISVIMITVSAAAVMFFAMPSAFAAPPTITSFSPTSGPAGCVVVITGTSFTDFPAALTTITFVSPGAVETPATPFVVVSATEIFATVPGLTAGTSYTIRVTNPSGTATSAGTFASTLGAGACAPTISSFTSGVVGATVTIVGSNLLEDVNTGGDVTFFDNKTAAPTGGPLSPTQLSVLVPAGATTGPIMVTTPRGTASSATSFTVLNGEPPPAPGGSPSKVFTNTEPEVCAVVDADGETAMPTPLTVGEQSQLLVSFTSERSGFGTHIELLVAFEIVAGDDVVASTPFEWGNLGVPLRRGHTSGTLMWSFDDVSPGDYTVRVGARVDPLPGSLGEGTATAVLENCALSVFVIEGA